MPTDQDNELNLRAIDTLLTIAHALAIANAGIAENLEDVLSPEDLLAAAYEQLQQEKNPQ